MRSGRDRGAQRVGKSTLAAELMRRGAPLFADDVLTLGREENGVVEAHPGSPHVNIGPGPAGSIEPEQLGPVLASFPKSAGSKCSGRLVDAPGGRDRSAGAASRDCRWRSKPWPHHLSFWLLTCSACPMTSPGGRRSRFALYSDLVESTALLRLTGGVADEPAELADVLEQELASLPTRRDADCRSGRGMKARARCSRQLEPSNGTPVPAARARRCRSPCAGSASAGRATSRRCSTSVDLQLDLGSKTWIGGRNGVGKTTLLRIAAGLIDPDRGRAEVWGFTPLSAAAATSAWSPSCPPATAASTRASRCGTSSNSGRESRWSTAARFEPRPSEAIDRFELAELAEQRVDRCRWASASACGSR